MVKTALLFSFENFQNCVVSRGRLGSQPPLSHRVTPETSPWRSARVSHSCSLANTVDTVFLRSYFLHRYFLFITIFSILNFTQMILTLSQTFCTSAVLLHVCKVCLRYERWIKQQSGRQQIWPLTNQNKGNFGSVLTAHHVCLCFLYDNHALCTECRNQVCNINLIYYKCHDWIIMKRKTFVHYNSKLRIKR